MRMLRWNTALWLRLLLVPPPCSTCASLRSVLTQLRLQATSMSAKTSRLPYLIAALFVVGVVAAAWQSRGRLKPVEAGFPVPAFEVTDLDGNLVTLDDYAGKVVLLNIWATWCRPCLEEMPSMERLYKELDP